MKLGVLPRRPGWMDVVASAFLPGALLGTQIAGLLFFLNPHLPFAPLPVLEGVILYAALLGGVSLLAHLPWTWGRPERARRLLPWTLTLALALAALADGFHASYYAFFLPSAVNERLIKAALWLGVTALICFYTALLHSVHGRPYGLRSRLGLAFLAVASIYVMVERREAAQPRPESDPRSSTVAPTRRPQLLVVGLEGATLDAILPLAEQGRLPLFVRLLHEGTYARLSSVTPNRRRPLWTTLATGKYPYKHGILGRRFYTATFLGREVELRLLPVGMGFRRWGTLGGPGHEVDSRARHSLALWEILSRLGVPTGLVGWPSSGPVPENLTFALSDAFFESASDHREVWPPGLEERARLFRLQPDEMDPLLRARFGPAPPAPVLKALARDQWQDSLTFFLLDQQPEVESLLVVLPGLLQVSQRYFGGYAGFQFEGRQDPVHREAAQILAAYYAYLDEFLARLLEKRPGPRVLAVVSAYGTEEPGGRRKLWGEITRRPPLEGDVTASPDGILILHGEGIRPGVFLNQARLVDLVPTLLYTLGYPVARDFDGNVLIGAFDGDFLSRNPVTFLPSYEALAASPE